MTVKQIHIEKYDFEDFEKEQKPFAMIRTDVIQRLPMKHANEFLLWTYLESLPETWKPNKAQLTKHFAIADRTYERYMSWLNAVGLIEYRQKRENDGSFGKGRLVVLNGLNFNPDAAFTRSAKIGGAVVNRIKKAQIVQLHRTAKLPLNGCGVERSNDAHIKTTKTNRKDTEKTINKDAPLVSVFADAESVKDHINLIVANRQHLVEEPVIEEIVYYIGSERNFDAVVKKINIALKLVREGRWNTPQNYKGISSQSIRAKEEAAHIEKQNQYKQEAQAFQNITQAVRTGGSPRKLSEMLQQYRDGLNAQQTGLPEAAIQNRDQTRRLA